MWDLKQACRLCNHGYLALVPNGKAIIIIITIRYRPRAGYLQLYRVSQEEWTKLRESVPYVKIYRYNPKHLYPKLNGYGDNGKRSLKL